MMDKVDMSLDDIIKQTKEFRIAGRRGRGGPRGGSFQRRGGRGNPRGSGFGGGAMRNRRGSFGAQRSPYSRVIKFYVRCASSSYFPFVGSIPGHLFGQEYCNILSRIYKNGSLYYKSLSVLFIMF